MAEIGTILGGRYRVVAQLGQGGMATIYRAIDTQLGREVAVKLLRPEYLRDPDFGSRFRQEAQNAASLSHPNVVTVYDYGEDPSGPFIVMEYVDGEDLATILRRNAPLPPVQATRIAAAVARALDAAHARGIVHRDVKPGNVLIGRDGRVKVVDFGIARAIAEAQMTLPGTTLGSVHYFSPEQARGEPATAASDIYSLGIVLYEMLTGSRPWEGDSAASVALARLQGPVPDPARIRPSIPPALALVSRTAMATDPEDRYASAGAMADALEATLPASAGVSSGAPAAGVAAAAAGVAAANPTVAKPTVAYPPEAYASADDAPPPAPKPDTPPPTEDEEQKTSPVVWIAGAIAIALLAAVAFLVFQLLSGPGEAGQDEVTVPNFVGRLIEDATREADGLGIQLMQTPQETTDQPPGTILAQDPPADTVVAEGSQVRVTVAVGLSQVPAPDLRNKTEAQAVSELINAGLQPGVRSEAFDPTVPVGLIVSQNPNPGVLLARDSPVDYVISRGPEPTPSPTPTPTPTPPPTPTPTPPPTPTPTPTPPPTAPPPTAAFDCQVSGLSVDCDASGSSGAASWSWDFGDGSSETGETASHDYAAAGDYTITLTVESADGVEDSDSASFTVGP